MDYKKYSLENLENWLYDAMSAGEATPQEIYDVIVNVVKDNYYVYKKQASEAYELLALLNGNGKDHLSCDKDDPSPECKSAWNDFWEEKYYPEEHKKSTNPKVEDIMPPWGHSDMEALRYTEEELNAMCDKAASDEEKNKCREYNLREAEYYDKRAKVDKSYDDMISSGYTMTADGFWIPPEQKEDKVVKWQLPVEVDGLSGECYLNLPDDLLEAANLKEGDTVKWVDNKNGTYTMVKTTEPLKIEEC